MTVYASTTFAPDGSPATQVARELVDHGVRRIELGSNHAAEDGLESAFRTLGGEYLVHNYFPPPRDSFVVNVASDDEPLRRRSLTHATDGLEFAARVGAPLYTFHPGFLGDPVAASRRPGRYDFQFGCDPPTAYDAAFARFLDAARVLVARAETLGVHVAVETEGSVRKGDRLLLQRPEEFDALFAAVPSTALGVNLNLGHLNLAANAYAFDRHTFIDRVAARVLAFELSDNDGTEDEHRPPVPGAWYWDIVTDGRFAAVPVIVECRDTPVETIVASVAVLEAARPSPERRKA